MPTYYRPTERRGKRVVYTSIDPGEPKRQRVKNLVFFAIVASVILFATAIALWKQ